MNQEIPAGHVPAAWQALLRRRLNAVSHAALRLPPVLRPGLTDDVARYILTGAGAEVLSEMRSYPLRLVCCAAEVPDAPDVYEGFNELPAAVALRWARTLEAEILNDLLGWGRLAFPGGRYWPDMLLASDAGYPIGIARGPVRPGKVRAEALEAMLVEDGLPASAALEVTFTAVLTAQRGFHHECGHRALLICDMPGYADMLDRHLEAIAPCLGQGGQNHALHVLGMLERAHDGTLARLAEPLCKLATSGTAQASAARALLQRCADAALPVMTALALKGKVERRILALRWLAATARAKGDAALWRDVAQRIDGDQAPEVQALSHEIGDMPAPGAAKAEAEAASPPVPAEAPVEVPVDDLGRLLGKFWQDVRKGWDQFKDNHAFAPLRHLGPFTEAEVEALFEFQLSTQWRPPDPFVAQAPHGYSVYSYTSKAVRALAAQPGATPTLLLKTLLFIDPRLTGHASNLVVFLMVIDYFAEMYRHQARPTLLELSSLLSAAGIDGSALLTTGLLGLGKRWRDRDQWPFMVQHAPLLASLLQAPQAKTFPPYRDALHGALRTLPTLPACLVHVLFEQALGDSPELRAEAQALLPRDAAMVSRMGEALAFPQARQRLWAATWLRRAGDREAVPALAAAWQAEPDEAARDALLEALLALGGADAARLDRAWLLAQVREGGRQTVVPKALAWLPWDQLPAVAWAGDVEAPGDVPADVLQWLLGLAFKRKQAEPTVMLRQVCGLFHLPSREAFGQALLEMWMQQASSQQAGSIGLLAVVAACGGGAGVEPAAAYLDHWYGNRLVQGKALLAMLSWIDHPTATEHLLSVARGFKTRSLSEEAARLAGALAQRRGWPEPELWDRMIDSAGADARGRRVATAEDGTETVVAELLPSLAWHWLVETTDAKPAQKALKLVVAQQTQRLEDAFHVERRWSVGHWQAWWLRHPVTRYLVCRAVWVCRAQGREDLVFRPLEDGSGQVVDSEGGAIELPSHGTVVLANAFIVPASRMAEWREHLARRQLAPLLPDQFLPAIEPPADLSVTGLGDVNGRVVAATLLKRRAQQQGFAVENLKLLKHWPAASLKAAVDCRHVMGPKGVIQVTLGALHFSPHDHPLDSWPDHLPLDRVPRVLLSSCRAALGALGV